jgi:hypothetical protein
MDERRSFWPVAVAEEKSGYTRDELLTAQGVEALIRRYADGTSEEALLVPHYLTDPQPPAADEL